MVHWIPYAFVRIVLFLAGGIVLGIFNAGIVPEIFAQGALALLLMGYLALFVLRKVFLVAINPGLAGLAAIFVGAYVLVLSRTDARHADHILHLRAPVEFYQCVVTRPGDERQRSWRLEAQVVQVKDTLWRPASGTVLLYLSKADFEKPFRYGDVLLVKRSPTAIPAPANPGEFDYKRYQAFRKIYHQHFLRRHDVRHTGHAPPHAVMDGAIRTREWAAGIIRTYIHGEREQATVSALVLGVTDGLDQELLSAYAATGAMHVLAVSGLHISILYMIIAWVLRPLNRTSKGKWALAVISLLVLWGYAFVTGLSPSVLRAVAMFSFVAVARPWHQRIDIYNILAASAFCLLLYEPYFIMSLGFQLSYMAVLGIVYLQPPLYRLWEPQAWLWDEVWKITSVSIAAQVATLPVSLLYFHQFPNYFLLANMLMIPGSFLVLVGGLAMIAAGAVPPVAAALGFLLEHLMRWLNAIVFTIGSWPGSVVDGIYLSPLQACVLAAILVGALLLIRYRRFYYFTTVCMLVAVYAALQWAHHYRDVRRHSVTVYTVRGHTAVDFFDHGSMAFYSDSALAANPYKQNFHMAPNRLLHGATPATALAIARRPCPAGMLIVAKGWTVLQIDRRKAHLPDNLSVDCLLLSNNAVADLKTIRGVKASHIVIDSSNSAFISHKLREQAQALGVKVHAVMEEGAWTWSGD